MLLRHWLDDTHRPTRDLDLLGFGEVIRSLRLAISEKLVRF